MLESHNPNLTSSEIGTLWNTYIADTLSACILKHFIVTTEDLEIKEILDYSFSCSQEHIRTIRELFQVEGIPTPNGFGDNDVNLDAPKLFADPYYLRYLEHMGRTGLNTYSLAKSISSRKDVRTLYKEWYDQTDKLYDLVADLSLEKGLYIRTPYIPYPNKVEYVTDKHFLGGTLGRQRPLLAIEISHLGTNIEINNVGKTLLLGFAQVAQSKRLSDYFKRGYNIGKKHAEIFLKVLKDDDVAYPSTWDSEIENTTNPPYSDRLMLFHTGLLSAIGIADYGAAISGSLRKDIVSHYVRLMAESTQYANEGAQFLIEHGWMEKPPQTPDREKIRNQKN